MRQPISEADEAMLMACVDLVGRAGASEFDLGYLHDDVPIDKAGWYASAKYRGARIIAENRPSPVDAAYGLAVKLLTGARCKCGRIVSLEWTEDKGRCVWAVRNKRWESTCDAPPVHVDASRGDHDAMVRAFDARIAENRAARRKRAREAKRGKS